MRGIYTAIYPLALRLLWVYRWLIVDDKVCTMLKGSRIDNEVLLNAGLDLMRQNGKPLTKLPSRSRSKLYALPNGETVRARTCNDHILIVVADKPSSDAKLNIEGTDWLLVVMPEVERTPGKLVAYLVPTVEAAASARRTHQDWLDTNPNTKNGNTTWNLWFSPDGPAKANDFAAKWATYRLEGESTTDSAGARTESEAAGTGGNIKAEVEAARDRIAKAAGVTAEAVRISIDFGV